MNRVHLYIISNSRDSGGVSWGVVLKSDDKQSELSGFGALWTDNGIACHGIWHGLNKLKSACDVIVHTKIPDLMACKEWKKMPKVEHKIRVITEGDGKEMSIASAICQDAMEEMFG